MATRKEIRSIAELFADVAYRKQRAAQARFAGTSPGQESPRDVYLAACASIGRHLDESFGFKYSKSGPHARRQSGDFIFEIRFQSDHNNVSGERVGLWIHGNVKSLKIKKWRQSHPPLLPFDGIAGGQLGNLQEKHCWIDWDLARVDKRDEVIRDAIRAIEELAFPYFARFDNLPSLFNLLTNADLPSMPIDRAIEFLMCFADQPTAKLAAANFFRRRPDLVGAYRGEFERYAQCDLNSQHPSGYARQLAFASHFFSFGDLTLERGALP